MSADLVGPGKAADRRYGGRRLRLPRFVGFGPAAAAVPAGGFLEPPRQLAISGCWG